MAARRFPIEVVISGVDRVTAPLRRINERINRAFSPLRRLSKSLGALSKEAGIPRLASAMGNLYDKTAGVVDQMRRLAIRVAAAAGLAGGGIFKITQATAGLGDEVAKTAERLGVGVEWLQEMRYAADSAGVSSSTFDMAIQRAGRRIGEFAATGKSEAASAIQALGLQVLDANGKLRSMEELLPEIADKLARIRSPMVRNALAMRFFDSEGVKLVQMFRDGSRGMDALRARARELGLVLGKDSVRDTEDYVTALADTKAALTGVRNIIGVELMPVVRDLALRLTAFLTENREAITAWAQRFAEAIPTFDQMRTFVADLFERLRPIANAFQWVADKIGVANTALLVIGAYIGGPLIASLIALSGAFAKLGIAMMTTPIGWTVAAIAGLIAVGVVLVKNWDKISEWWSGVWDGITERVQRAIGWIRDKVGSLRRVLPTWLGGTDASAESPVAGDSLLLQPERVLEEGAAAAPARSEAHVVVDFRNLPQGTRVESDRRSTADLDLAMGYSLLPGGA